MKLHAMDKAKGPWAVSAVCVALALVLCLCSTASGAPDGSFSCPREHRCSCAQLESQGLYEIDCIEDGVTLKLTHGSSALLQCNLHTSPGAYASLSEVNVWAGKTLRFTLCPLPEKPFTKLMQLTNAADIATLQIDSYRLMNNTLERQHFLGLTGILRLLLANNGLTALPSDLLMDMPHLRTLDLRNNRVQLPADVFQPVLGLETLDLGSNELTTLPMGLFRNLKKLILLNLWKNKLSSLEPEMFSDLKNLTTLDLSNNGMTSFPADVFKYLVSLKTLSLNGNNFKTLPSGLFQHNHMLETVQLYDSRNSELTLPSGLFSNLPSLKTVMLHKNGLKKLPGDLFLGSPALLNITLYDNQLKELPENLFHDTANLQKLKLSYNKLRGLPDKVFSQLSKLRVLDLSFNKLTNISKDTLSGLGQLEDLMLQNNLLRHTDSNAFHATKNLRTISLANNRLSFLDEGAEGSLRYQDLFGEYSPLRHCIVLEKIDLSNNSISEIFADWRVTMTSLQMLNISHNMLQTLSFPSVAFTANVEVDVRHNNVSNIDLRGTEAYALAQQHKKRQKWLLEGNPLWCDCTNYDLFRYFEKKIAPEVLSLIEIIPGELTCAGPAEVHNMQAVSVLSRAVTCTLTSEENETPCPQPCACNWRPADKAILVDCVRANLTVAPGKLPMRDFSNHTELYLNHNHLRALPDFTFPGYANVTKLTVGYNNISSLNLTTLPSSMQLLELNHNNLTVLQLEDIQVLSNLTNMTSIRLDQNPWRCDCTLQPLVSFVQANFMKVMFREHVKCTDGQLLTDLTASGLCSQAGSVVWLSLIVALMLGLLIGGTFAVYYRFTHEIKAWLYAHNLCLWFVTEEELDKDKLYDAFVSYSHKDEEFVVNELVPGLEGGPTPFKLCLHYRDWVAGEWIPNQITRSVEDSRRTLVVLSPNFLESVWGRMEFRTAHCQALSEGRARVIVVLYGDIGPTENLDPELRAYLNMNTYVKWGDPWFWKKLRYALPHPPKALKPGMGMANRTAKAMNGKSLDDKIELICDPNTPPVTTPPADCNTIDPLSKNGLNGLNGKTPSPKKVPLPLHETNGTAAAVG